MTKYENVSIKEVHIVPGNDLADHWKDPMQKVLTSVNEEGECFIATMPPQGKVRWWEYVGTNSTVNIRIKESVEYQWIELLAD